MFDYLMLAAEFTIIDGGKAQLNGFIVNVTMTLLASSTSVLKQIKQCSMSIHKWPQLVFS